MKVLQPVAMTDVLLSSSSVTEDDYPAWSNLATYALGDRVISATTHRIYESLQDSNLGHDPTDEASTQWIDIGPTNRWAMFDQSLGPVTSRSGSITVMMMPGAIDAVAVLDATASTVRVQVNIGGYPAYDETLDATKAALTFLDLPSDPAAQLIVTIAGTGTVSVSELLIGNVLDLGETEASPSIGMIDYSRRTTDDFGTTTVQERGWSRTMSLRSKIDAAAVDAIQVALAKLRARPALWIGEGGFDSLTIFGWFKTFSIDLVINPFSYCSFTIEGLSE